MNRARAIALLLLALFAPTLAAQATSSPPAWRTLLTGEDGTSVSIDSATVDRTGEATFSVRTAIRFPRLILMPAGDSVDREVDSEELDCAGSRTRPHVSEVFR